MGNSGVWIQISNLASSLCAAPGEGVAADTMWGLSPRKTPRRRTRVNLSDGSVDIKSENDWGNDNCGFPVAPPAPLYSSPSPPRKPEEKDDDDSNRGLYSKLDVCVSDPNPHMDMAPPSELQYQSPRFSGNHRRQYGSVAALINHLTSKNPPTQQSTPVSIHVNNSTNIDDHQPRSQISVPESNIRALSPPAYSNESDDHISKIEENDCQKENIANMINDNIPRNNLLDNITQSPSPFSKTDQKNYIMNALNDQGLIDDKENLVNNRRKSRRKSRISTNVIKTKTDDSTSLPTEALPSSISITHAEDQGVNMDDWIGAMQCPLEEDDAQVGGGGRRRIRKRKDHMIASELKELGGTYRSRADIVSANVNGIWPVLLPSYRTSAVTVAPTNSNETNQWGNPILGRINLGVKTTVEPSINFVVTHEGSIDVNNDDGVDVADYKRAFLCYDESLDGRISVDELNSIVSRMELNVTEGEVADIVRRANTDGSGHICFNEFVSFMRQMRRDAERSGDDDGTHDRTKGAFQLFSATTINTLYLARQDLAVVSFQWTIFFQRIIYYCLITIGWTGIFGMRTKPLWTIFYTLAHSICVALPILYYYFDPPNISTFEVLGPMFFYLTLVVIRATNSASRGQFANQDQTLFQKERNLENLSIFCPFDSDVCTGGDVLDRLEIRVVTMRTKGLVQMFKDLSIVDIIMIVFLPFGASAIPTLCRLSQGHEPLADSTIAAKFIVIASIVTTFTVALYFLLILRYLSKMYRIILERMSTFSKLIYPNICVDENLPFLPLRSKQNILGWWSLRCFLKNDHPDSVAIKEQQVGLAYLLLISIALIGFTVVRFLTMGTDLALAWNNTDLILPIYIALVLNCFMLEVLNTVAKISESQISHKAMLVDQQLQLSLRLQDNLLQGNDLREEHQRIMVCDKLLDKLVNNMVMANNSIEILRMSINNNFMTALIGYMASGGGILLSAFLKARNSA